MATGSDLHALIASIALNAIEAKYADGRFIAQHGHVVPGTYNPKTGEIDVLVLSESTILTSNTEQPLIRRKIDLVTPVHGHQGGPTGGERVVLIPTDAGFIAVLTHGSDDSPGAPAGESWQGHSTGSAIKMQNSGNISVLSNAMTLLGITTGAQYAVIRTVDLMALITWLTTHVHSNGASPPTGTPTTTPPTPTGSPSVTAA